MRGFLKELITLSIVFLVVAVLTLVPYFSNRSELKREKQTNIYLCKFSAITREFATAATDARLITAQKGNPKLRKANLRAARVYEHVRNELKKLPPEVDCNNLIGAK